MKHNNKTLHSESWIQTKLWITFSKLRKIFRFEEFSSFRVTYMEQVFQNGKIIEFLVKFPKFIINEYNGNEETFWDEKHCSSSNCYIAWQHVYIGKKLIFLYKYKKKINMLLTIFFHKNYSGMNNWFWNWPFSLGISTK